MDLSSQERIKKAYSGFSSIFSEARENITSLSTTNKAFIPIQSAFKKQLENIIDNVSVQLNDVQKYAVWDKLVIAFIGVTNAGKSTIIETFRILFNEPERLEALKKRPSGVDGEIIGDGRADFTRVYKEYNMRIGDKEFVLIDVPGIEGNEKSVKDEILKALSKAHCVFYVQGEGKKPDTATVSKIKDYLKDWVKVYTIYNVRGTAFNYSEEDERSKFKTASIVKVEKEINDTMSKALGDNYAGCITLQARLALCARAKFAASQRELKQDQKELLECFGNSDDMFAFSNFKAIIDNVDYLADHFTDEILEAQRKKLYKLHVEAFRAIDDVSKSQMKDIDRMINRFKTCKRNIENHFSSSQHSIISQMRGEINEVFDILENNGCVYIDNDLDNDSLQNQLEEDKNELVEMTEHNFKVIVHNEFIDLQENIEHELTRLRESFALTSMRGDFSANVDLNLSGVLDELDFGFGDLVNWGTYLGASFMVGWGIAAGNFWNPIGWGAAAIMAGYAIFGPSKQNRAKKKWRESIGDARSDFFYSQWNDITSRIENEFDQKSDSIERQMDAIINDFKAIKKQMSTVIDKIKRNANKYK